MEAYLLIRGSIYFMSFSTYLRGKLGELEINSRSLIAKLQLFSSAFEKLDPVTLSRWLNDRTTPSLEKQLLVLSCFESEFYPYLEYVSAPAVSRSITKVFEQVFDSIESSYHSILTYKEVLDSDACPSIEKVSWFELKSLVPNFYESTMSYERFFSEIDTDEQSNINFCAIRSGSKVMSHVSFSTDVHYLTSIFGNNIDINFNKKTLFINLGHYASRKHYEALVGIVLNHICNSFGDIDDFYVVSRGTDFLNLIEVFGGKVISANREESAVGNIYLIKVNLFESLVNPFIYSLLKDSYEVYHKIENSKWINT